MMFTIDTVLKPSFVKQVCKSTSAGRPYFIYTLEPEFLPNGDIENRMYRSIIQDAETQQILSVAPAKSLANDVFLNAFTGDDVSITKIVEGTMINLFYSELVGGWEIATRNNIGGNTHFFRTQYGGADAVEPTFKQMFYEAIGIATGEKAIGEKAIGENTFDNLDKTVCYSFVLQHPANHIVLNVENPIAVLVSAYKLEKSIDNNAYHVKYMDINELGTQFTLPNHEENCKLTASQFEMIKCQVENPINPHTNVGIMITHLKSGLRTAIFNPRYQEIKLLRGNNPNLHYQYLVLRKVNKVSDFLRYFPQYSAQFKIFQNHFELYATRLHNLYLSVRVFKTVSLDNIADKRDKYHLEKLHYEVFIPMMKMYIENRKEGAKPKMTRGRVKQYLDMENVIVPF